MLRIGLTGGIASGKSTLANALQQLGIPVIDADLVSRELMRPGESGYRASVDHFGPEILDEQGRIDRVALRRRVFEDPQERLWLEQMLHPMIRQRIEQTITELEQRQAGDLVLVVVPLLFESGFDDLVDVSVAIDCPRELQIQRLRERDNLDTELARRMIEAQLSNDQRLARADLSIRNDGSAPVSELAEELLQRLRDKASASRL